ncbi:putative transcription initiation factor IIF subunit alpha [Leptodontidium sp. MPI-SDFR-AT-0119]|nr:putative transcription initiation factor IIF subunit alpha [Leptodontidium sp. MPI-SDFR-AT-0119]
MSASPSGQSNGPTPNGGPPRSQFVRKPKAADPLVARKKPVRRQNLLPNASRPKRNGIVPGSGRQLPQYPVNGVMPPRGAGPGTVQQQNGMGAETANGGWTNVPIGPFQDYPLVTSKRDLREGLRYHIARFAAKKGVDPSDQNEFTRPVLLHRRDPKQPPPGKGIKDEDQIMTEAPIDSKEREKQEILKAEKEKQKAADLAQIAPTGNNASALAAKKNQSFRNEKTTQVHRLDKTEEQKKMSDLKYEEALPWHFEDADSKNIWVGNYEAALSDTNVVLVVEGSTFKMIPVEKWYKFTAKGKFEPFTIEEAEASFAKKSKESRWVMKSNEEKESARMAQDSKKAMHGLFTVKAESNTFKNAGKSETQDMDDLDFEEGDLFQDDDEQVTVEPDNDEDAKDAQERVKRDRQAANVFDQANEADVDEEEEEDKKEQEQRKKLGKEVTKALRKRERNFVYNSDSDHPYSESSDDDTSDEEKQKEIDRKKDEEAKNKVKLESASKLPSGTSSKGTNTPSGRPKHSDPLKKVKSLKRPGSPNLSESSGNESSRKKPKKKHQSSRASGSSTPIPGSRPMSPEPSQPGGSQDPRKSSIVKLTVNPNKVSNIQSAPPNPSPVRSGATSDGEATGGEMSDGGKKKKIKLVFTGTPNGSRAGSPAPGASGSRSGSPAAAPGGSPGRAQSPGAGPVQAYEVLAALPASGITLKDLLKGFAGRVQSDQDKKHFISLVKDNSKYGPDKLLRPR